MLKEGFKKGAAGLSFGLEYVKNTSKEEVMILSKTAAKHRKIVSVHSRTVGWAGLESFKEKKDKAGVYLEIEDLKCMELL